VQQVVCNTIHFTARQKTSTSDNATPVVQSHEDKKKPTPAAVGPRFLSLH